MKKWMVLVCVLLLTGFWTGVGLAEETDNDEHDVTITVNEVAQLEIEGGEVSFEVGSATDPGDAFEVTPTNEDAKYLQYTSIVATGATRKITVQQTDDLPSGVTLKVTPTTAGGGQGDLGSAQAAITLNDTSGSAADVVTGIGSCYTGTSGTDGVKLAYALTVEDTDVADLKTQTAQTYTVTYTLTAGTGS